jgi:pyruvate dehydrogenase E1 component alpha subunit
MVFSRRFEEQCYQSYVERKIGGFLHLYPGQEACAWGVMGAARPGFDWVITGYRDHVHALACGVPPHEVMAELFGKETGSSKGRGGSMHIFDVGRRFMGGYALVGGPFPLAAGMAKAIQMKRDLGDPEGEAVAICFLGDAANNQGTFHETLNMAAVWKLPVLFVCENNLYGIGTALHRSTAIHEQWKRAEGCGVTASFTDGQDVDAVHRAATAGLEHVRSGLGPYFLELLTYRFRGHSMSDAGAYRTASEVDEWKLRDPIRILHERLVATGEAEADLVATLEREADERVAACVRFAEESPEPDPKDALRYVLADGDPAVGGMR